jgi:hypothetical protein
MIVIPKELTELIERGWWPVETTDVNRQNLHSLIPEPGVRQFAPEESKVFFYPPPFQLVRNLFEGPESGFWSDPRTATSEIDPDLTMLIGDFGLGSDAPLALDFRKSPTNPSVIRLKWAAEGNHWVEVAPSFAAFINFLPEGTRLARECAMMDSLQERTLAEEGIDQELDAWPEY